MNLKNRQRAHNEDNRMNSKAFAYISKMPHFSFLPESELRKLAQTAIAQTYEAGTVIAEQGKTQVDRIYIVASGNLALYDQKHGESALTGYIKPGEVFGGITILLNGGISLRTVKVDKPCHGYAIARDVFQDMCARYPKFFEYFLENFSKHIFDPSISALIETSQVRHFLAGIEPFSFLSEPDLDLIAQEVTWIQYPAGTVLFVQGRTRIGYLYILQKGSVERYYEEKNHKDLREVLSEGDIYGGISMLVNDGISVRTVKVLEPSGFYMLPKQRFLDICQRYDSVTEFFTDAFGRRMLKKSYAAIIAKTMAPQGEGNDFFNRHVATIYSDNPVFATADMTIKQCAQTMAQNKISSLFVNAADGQCVGMVTERDLTRRVIAVGCDIERPVSEIMSSPVYSVPEFAMIFEALMTMMEHNIRHLAVTDVDENVVGILSNRDLLSAQGQSPIFFLHKMASANTIEEIVESHGRLPALVRTLISGGAKANNLTRFITRVADDILHKIMAKTIDQLGPPPVKFAFMILGSEGRKEQTLKTDQDNAIVFEDVPASELTRVRDYFLQFGEIACGLLDRAGYAFCEGGVMAKNPKWCQPVSAWQEYFSDWIHAAEPEQLRDASIFFDFEFGWGEKSMVDALRTYLFDSLKGWSGFFRHLTENALHFKPPLGFFRNFVVESKGEHRSALDIKSAMTPIVDFARIYALKYRIEQTNTLARLEHLRLKEVLKSQEYEEIETAYGFLMQVRLSRQVAAMIDEKSAPDNYINPKKLTRIEQKMLKEIFIRINKFQTKLEFEFIGMV